MRFPPSPCATRALRRVLALAACALVAGCAHLPDGSTDPDFALCEQARMHVRRGDLAAAEAAVDRMRDLRNAYDCRNDVLETEMGRFPRST